MKMFVLSMEFWGRNFRLQLYKW